MANHYERLQRDYPCDKRKGMGWGGCCNQPKRPVPGKVDCALHHHIVPWYECEECPYQERIGKQRELERRAKK